MAMEQVGNAILSPSCSDTTCSLYRVDGSSNVATAAATVPFTGSLSSLRGAALGGGEGLLFSVFSGTSSALWFSDGTPRGTYPLTDFADVSESSSGYSELRYGQQFGGKFSFTRWIDGLSDGLLYQTDGTPSGTRPAGFGLPIEARMSVAGDSLLLTGYDTTVGGNGGPPPISLFTLRTDDVVPQPLGSLIDATMFVEVMFHEGDAVIDASDLTDDVASSTPVHLDEANGELVVSLTEAVRNSLLLGKTHITVRLRTVTPCLRFDLLTRPVGQTEDGDRYGLTIRPTAQVVIDVYDANGRPVTNPRLSTCGTWTPATTRSRCIR